TTRSSSPARRPNPTATTGPSTAPSAPGDGRRGGLSPEIRRGSPNSGEGRARRRSGRASPRQRSPWVEQPSAHVCGGARVAIASLMLTRLSRALVVVTLGTVAMLGSGCSPEPRSGANSDVGSIGLALQLANGASLNTV